MKILKDRITLCDLEPEVAEMVYEFINELSDMLDEGFIISGFNENELENKKSELIIKFVKRDGN